MKGRWKNKPDGGALVSVNFSSDEDDKNWYTTSISSTVAKEKGIQNCLSRGDYGKMFHRLKNSGHTFKSITIEVWEEQARIANEEGLARLRELRKKWAEEDK